MKTGTLADPVSWLADPFVVLYEERGKKSDALGEKARNQASTCEYLSSEPPREETKVRTDRRMPLWPSLSLGT